VAVQPYSISEWPKFRRAVYFGAVAMQILSVSEAGADIRLNAILQG